MIKGFGLAVFCTLFCHLHWSPVSLWSIINISPCSKHFAWLFDGSYKKQDTILEQTANLECRVLSLWQIEGEKVSPIVQMSSIRFSLSSAKILYFSYMRIRMSWKYKLDPDLDWTVINPYYLGWLFQIHIWCPRNLYLYRGLAKLVNIIRKRLYSSPSDGYDRWI